MVISRLDRLARSMSDLQDIRKTLEHSGSQFKEKVTL
ncbi:MAG: hypothetical protein KUG74_17250 [Rhodobacteraceae bacterium]|nr:hypothetical protein [Paracoccaceae bacterium]